MASPLWFMPQHFTNKPIQSPAASLAVASSKVNDSCSLKQLQERFNRPRVGQKLSQHF
jgi:hypothetical protein